MSYNEEIVDYLGFSRLVKCIHNGPLNVEGSRRVGVREAFGDSLLLALTFKDGSWSQGMQEALETRIAKRRHCILPWITQKNPSPTNILS